MLRQNANGNLDLETSGGILGALRPEDRTEWQAVSVIAGGCGGCGTEPVMADLRFFRDQWLNNPQYRQTLLQPGFTHLGFALEANGEGRKLAMAVLGQHR